MRKESGVGDLPPCSSPLVGKQLGQSALGMSADVFKDVAQIGKRIDVEPPRGLGRGAIAAALLVHHREKCTPPPPERDAATIATSMGEYPAGNQAGAKPNLLAPSVHNPGNAERIINRLASGCDDEIK